MDSPDFQKWRQACSCLHHSLPSGRLGKKPTQQIISSHVFLLSWRKRKECKNSDHRHSSPCIFFPYWSYCDIQAKTWDTTNESRKKQQLLLSRETPPSALRHDSCLSESLIPPGLADRNPRRFPQKPQPLESQRVKIYGLKVTPWEIKTSLAQCLWWYISSIKYISTIGPKNCWESLLLLDEF